MEFQGKLLLRFPDLHWKKKMEPEFRLESRLSMEILEEFCFHCHIYKKFGNEILILSKQIIILV